MTRSNLKQPKAAEDYLGNREAPGLLGAEALAGDIAGFFARTPQKAQGMLF